MQRASHGLETQEASLEASCFDALPAWLSQQPQHRTGVTRSSSESGGTYWVKQPRVSETGLSSLKLSSVVFWGFCH